MSVKEFQEATRGRIDPKDWVIKGRDMGGYDHLSPASIYGCYVISVDMALDAQNHITSGECEVTLGGL
jgi:hypothetical protein